VCRVVCTPTVAVTVALMLVVSEVTAVDGIGDEIELLKAPAVENDTGTPARHVNVQDRRGHERAAVD
jgi:hypothetical protein